MIRADFSKCKNLFLSYPKGFLNEYEALGPFMDKLIELIPEDIHLFIVVNTKKVKRELEVKFEHKRNYDVLVVNFWDELWLRDCMGLSAEDKIYKFNYAPNYCSLKHEAAYYKYINKLTKRVLAETLNPQIIEVPLNIDGGNFVHNTKKAFLTNKVYEDNPGLNIEKIIADYTGLDAIVVGRNPHDVIGHADGYMAFKSEDTLFISEYQKQPFIHKDIKYVKSLRSIAIQNNFKVLPLFDNPVDEHINCACKKKKTRSCLYSARGLYINYIRFNDYIIMPEYSVAANSPVEFNWMNKKWLENLGFKVLTINCDQLAKYGGSLHCLSFQA